MKKHEPKYVEVEGIMRACYDSFLKTGNKAYSEIIALADAVPAADVAEVRHGRWEDVEPAPHNLFYATCSVCGDRQTIEVANYCPMCGASMDEVSE